MSKDNIDSIAKKILFYVGDCHKDSNDNCNNPYLFHYECSYEGYGFKIKSIYDSDESYNDKLIRTNAKDISILFHDRKVFDSTDGYYVPAEWEDILKVVYDKLPSELSDKENKKMNATTIAKYLDNYEKSCLGEKEFALELLSDNNIFLKGVTGTDGDAQAYDCDFFTEYRVYKNMEMVLDMKYYGMKYDTCSDESYYDYDVFVIKPGNWMYEFQDCLDHARIECAQKDNNILNQKSKKYLQVFKNK